MTGALWLLPTVLCGLAAREASRPVYLSVSSLLFQKGPVAMAVTTPQQTPVVMTPQAPAQAASQPLQPPQTGNATAPGAPVVSQVCSLNCPTLLTLPPPPTFHPEGCGHCHSCQQAGCVISSAWNPQPHCLTQLDMDKESHTCRLQSYIHTSTRQPKDVQIQTYSKDTVLIPVCVCTQP